jgi:hypothetical protein
LSLVRLTFVQADLHKTLLGRHAEKAPMPSTQDFNHAVVEPRSGWPGNGPNGNRRFASLPPPSPSDFWSPVDSIGVLKSDLLKQEGRLFTTPSPGTA